MQSYEAGPVLCGVSHLFVCRQQLGHPLPDGPCAALLGEPEHCIRAPACVILAVDDIADSTVNVDCGNPLPQPFALHLCGRHTPHLQMRQQAEGTGCHHSSISTDVLLLCNTHTMAY
jgi:hypothetical protein